MQVRHDWTTEEIKAIYDLPLLDLVYRAATVHRQSFGDHAVQLCSLLSIKTGGCAEDCGYCSQSARHSTGVKAEKLMEVSDVLERARAAKDAGASRFCMGAAWRQVRNGRQFDSVLEMVTGVREMGMEACVTLGMLTPDQAQRLAEAGLTAYNHNLDTSREYYDKVVGTRTYDDRLDTLQNARDAGLRVCCGGILGLGESVDDRASMLATLANMAVQPESVPVNALVPVEGTPMSHHKPVESTDMVRTIAAARITMPFAKIRLSAGRNELNDEAQLLCIMAGANSIFFGDTLLTTPNPEVSSDFALLRKAGVRALEPAAT